ncbi:CoA-binding protein [Hydrogenophaga sp.]|uniref:acetate--CoA ligase family protein n=1 Tax=Hydrogenophaga sp. TaxID=1904254 RepID=UPI0026092306|nr:CoA-binding protein [Hydrogenophaga sp.]MCW5654270.1 CoA-binding protein [Hydrogenophaga sp.]
MTQFADLRPLFQPRSIVVVGASRNPRSISGQPLHHLVTHGYAGKLYAVNPSVNEINGIACYPDVTVLPDSPDLAVIAVAADQVPAVLEQCGARNVRIAIVLSSGFAELSDEGAKAQQAMVQVAARHGIRLIGPNCQGMISTSSNVYAGFGGPMALTYASGGLSVASQSGGFGMSIASMADEQGLGIAQVISTGNEADLGLVDVLDHCIKDPGTRVMATYIEGLRRPGALLDVGRRALDAGKPIIAWKVGVSPEGARAAAAHTGSQSGDDDMYNNLFREAGIVRASDNEEIVDLVQVFSGCTMPKGDRVAVLTVSGGAGVAVADALVQHGCELPLPDPHLRQRLAGLLPPYVSCGNPVDITAAAFNTPHLFAAALQELVDNPAHDILVVMLAALPDAVAEVAAADIVRIRQSQDKPVVVCFSTRPEIAPGAHHLFRKAGIPVLTTPSRTGRAVGKLAAYARTRSRR